MYTFKSVNIIAPAWLVIKCYAWKVRNYYSTANVAARATADARAMAEQNLEEMLGAL